MAYDDVTIIVQVQIKRFWRKKEREKERERERVGRCDENVEIETRCRATILKKI